jgi:hypothetical protein
MIKEVGEFVAGGGVTMVMVTVIAEWCGKVPETP